MGGLRTTWEDRWLVGGLRRGDHRAQARFLDRFGGRLWTLARRHTDRDADAEDLTQEILLAAVTAVGTFRGDSSLNTFVYRIALNLCWKRRRSQRPETQCLDGVDVAAGVGSDPQRHAERRELADCLARAMDLLSDEHRLVVELHELHQLTYAECAQLLDIPVGTVKSRLFHAFRKLRPLLAEYEEVAAV